MQKEHCMMRRITHIILLLVTAIPVLVSCSKESPEPQLVATALSSPEVEQELLGLVNAHRNSQGYAALAFSPVAYEYASDHTDYMIATGTINHSNFSSRAEHIAAEAGAVEVAENVARDYDTASEALSGWLASNAHRTTLEGDFTHTAVSVKQDALGNYYFTQLFFREGP